MNQHEAEKHNQLCDKVAKYEKALNQIAQYPFNAEGSSLTWKDISGYQTRTAKKALNQE